MTIKQAGGAERGEFFQVQIEASASPHIKHTEPGLYNALGPLETAAKKTLDQSPINIFQPYRMRGNNLWQRQLWSTT